MIRHKQGSDFLLITQNDHAHLSGWFAESFGNAVFVSPTPRDEVIRGVALHDCGWPLHDGRPTLNPRGLPLHVLESPMTIATQVWSASASGAAEEGAYAGLLVSLHVLHLSAMAQKHDSTPHERYANRHDLFLLNRFQQEQIELQENLRKTLGLRTDLPLNLGLARPGSGDQEDILRFNFRLLQAMDRISLDLCCSEDLFATLDHVHKRPGELPIEIRVTHRRPGELVLTPWPFDRSFLETSISCKRVPGRAYASEAELQAIYDAAPVEAFPVRLVCE